MDQVGTLPAKYVLSRVEMNIEVIVLWIMELLGQCIDRMAAAKHCFLVHVNALVDIFVRVVVGRASNHYDRAQGAVQHRHHSVQLEICCLTHHSYYPECLFVFIALNVMVRYRCLYLDIPHIQNIFWLWKRWCELVNTLMDRILNRIRIPPTSVGCLLTFALEGMMMFQTVDCMMNFSSPRKVQEI